MSNDSKSVALAPVLSVQSLCKKHAKHLVAGAKDFQQVLKSAHLETNAGFLEQLADIQKGIVADFENIEITTNKLMAAVVDDVQKTQKNANSLRTVR